MSLCVRREAKASIASPWPGRRHRSIAVFIAHIFAFSKNMGTQQAGMSPLVLLHIISHVSQYCMGPSLLMWIWMLK